MSAPYCFTHKRTATHKDRHGQPCCDPRLGGIMISCHIEAERVRTCEAYPCNQCGRQIMLLADHTCEDCKTQHD